MGKIASKRLVLDHERVRELAAIRGMSESAAVREAIEQALGWQRMAEVWEQVAEEISSRGGIDDAFGKLDLEREAIECEQRRASTGT